MMPVGWGCGSGWYGCRGSGSVFVVGHRSRWPVATSVAGYGGRAAASSTESDRGSGERRPSGYVVVSRCRCSTARCVVPCGLDVRSGGWAFGLRLGGECGEHLKQGVGAQWWRGGMQLRGRCRERVRRMAGVMRGCGAGKHGSLTVEMNLGLRRSITGR